MKTIWTIGHSRTPAACFIELLTRHHLEMLIDARSQPYSRIAPQFNRQALQMVLAREGIVYRYLGEQLGGRPKDQRYVLPDGKIDYPRLAQAPFYRQGLAELRQAAGQSRLVIMCAEADYRRCHRYWLITRSLVNDGVEVQHILASGEVVGTNPAELLVRPRQLPLL